MNPPNSQRFSREQKKDLIPAGERRTFDINGDYWFVHSMQTGSEAGADVEIQLAVNGRGFAPAGKGENGQGTPGQAEIKTLEFYNDTGSAVFVRVICGNGSRPYSPRVEISNPTLELGEDTIDALNPPAETAEPGWDVVDDEEWIFSGMSGIAIVNTGSANITVYSSRFPGGRTLGVSESVEWTVNGRFDLIGDVTVDATGSVAEVTTVGGTGEVVTP